MPDIHLVVAGVLAMELQLRALVLLLIENGLIKVIDDA